MALSTRSASVFTEGTYTGKMTTQLIGGYEGYADVTVTLSKNSNLDGFDAKVTMDLTGSNCYTMVTQKLIFPLPHMEFTAKFVTKDIKETTNTNHKPVVIAEVSGTASIPFVEKLPSIIKPYMKDEISSSTTIEKDAEGNIAAKVSMFGVVTMFGSIKKKETPVVEQKHSSPSLTRNVEDVD